MFIRRRQRSIGMAIHGSDPAASGKQSTPKAESLETHNPDYDEFFLTLYDRKGIFHRNSDVYLYKPVLFDGVRLSFSEGFVDIPAKLLREMGQIYTGVTV